MESRCINAWTGTRRNYALTSAPLLVVVLCPAGYPMLVLLVLMAQFLYSAAWAMLYLAGLGMVRTILAIAIPAALVPPGEFWSRWQSAMQPD